MRSTKEPGFTLIELIVVAGIIMIMAAVAVPRIARYFRNYQINSAAREVTGEIQGARNRAVMKNVNYGSVFYVASATTYRTALEDDQTVPRTPRRLSLGEAEDTANFPGQVTPLRQLPGDVRFGTGCTSSGVFTPNDTGVRFTRLGAACNPGTGTTPPECPGALAVPGSPPNLVWNDATGASFICLTQPSTGLRRLIRIAPGGRVTSMEGQG